MDNLEWKKISEDEPVKIGWRSIIKKSFKMPDGKTVDYFIKKEGGVVCVLALTPDNKVIIAKQFRPGPEKIFSELPGGGVERDETPEQAIKRELLEETGYQGNFKLVGSTYRCAYSDSKIYCFVATDCKKIMTPKSDSTEFIEVELMELDDFKEHLLKGELTDLTTGFMGLNYLGYINF